jgi:amino acid adenylation domain-containing protein
MAPVFPIMKQPVCHEQSDNFRRLIRYVWQRSAFYRDYYSSHGIREKDLAEISLGDLPLLTKKTLMENFDLAVTDHRLHRRELEEWADANTHPEENFCNDFVVIRSSGTSGYQGTIVYDQFAWRFANAIATYRLPRPANYPHRTRLAWYVDSHDSRGGDISLAKRISARLYETLIVSLMEDPQSVVEKLNRFQPSRLTGYSSIIASLARSALEKKLRIRPTDIVVGGDLMTEGMKTAIQEAWNAPITAIYAASESLYIAVRGPTQDDLEVLEELNLVEVLGNDNCAVSAGERGRVVVTNLYNYTLPILRYELGDHVEVGKEEDGRVTSIRSINGRMNDALPVTLKDGRRGFIHPMVFPIYVPGVEKMQFISRGPDHVRVDYVAGSAIDDQVRGKFQQILDAFGAKCTTFEVTKVVNIPNDPKTGKFTMVRLAEDLSGASLGSSMPVSLHEPISHHSEKGDASFIKFGESDMESTIAERFAQQVRKYSGRVAIKTPSEERTYDELNAFSNRVAHALLRNRGIGAEPIALLMESGSAVVSTILGVLNAGKIYLPLDPAYPQARIRAMLEDSESRLIITSARHHNLAHELAGNGAQIMNVDELDSSLSSEDLQLSLSADTLACILYTSGSTGEPKGVVHSHRNILHKTKEYTRVLQLSSEDKIALLSPCTFSLSVGFIFGALLNGGCLYPVNVRGEGLSHLADWFRQEEITVYNSVPAVFRSFVRAFSAQQNLPKLRLVHLGGEPVTAMDVELYKRRFSSDCLLVHHLGSNETGTIAYSFIDKKTPIHGDIAPAGHSPEGSQILVLEEDGTPLGFNRIGEIAVKSPFLAVGYWRKPELTRAAFLRAGDHERIYRTGDMGLLRPDGSLEHDGRKDFQMKIRGQRVEVSEIDMALARHAAVKEAVTVAREDSRGDKCLVSYVVPESGRSVSSKQLRTFLQQRLPDYMVPSSIVFLDAMPLTLSGKLDRRALPAPTLEVDDEPLKHVLPKDGVEQKLAEIWKDLLGVETVGIHDNFFDIGGHSLLLIQLHGQLQAAFAVNMPMIELFRSTTISAQADYLSQATAPPAQAGSRERCERGRTAQQIQRGLQAMAERNVSRRRGK